MAEKTRESWAPPKDPRDKAPIPPFPAQDQEFPGTEAAMIPRADHGEQSYRGANRLKDRVALITGADSGIGRAVALAYAREGADIIISYFNEEEDARATERLVVDAGRRTIRMAGDIADEAHCRALVDRAFNELGRLDILVNNAAYQMTYDSIDQIPSDDFDRTFRVNVYAMFYLCKAALPRMKPGGVILNTASINTFDPSPNLLAYAATKGAIANFSTALAKLAAKQGVRVNSVAPGPVWTPLIPYSMSQEKIEKFGENTLLGRPAQPAELAPVYVLLASDEGSYITGEVYGVTGGRKQL